MPDLEIQKAIRTAVKQGHTDEFIRLVGDNPERLNMTTVFGTWLHVAASRCQLEIAKWLIGAGADVNAYGGVADAAPLHRAASDGHLEMVRLLLDCGAELDTSEPERNPLFGAIYNGHTEIAKLLIDSGIDTSVVYSSESMSKKDAYHYARKWGRTDIMKLLEETEG